MSSIVELIKTDIVNVVSAITTGNGYRNDLNVGTVLLDPGAVTAFPHAVVVITDGWIDGLTDDKETMAEFITFAVIGYVESQTVTGRGDDNGLSNAAESLIHDLKRALSAAVITNINSATLRSLISKKEKMFTIVRLYADNAEKGLISINFTVKVRYNTSSTF